MHRVFLTVLFLLGVPAHSASFVQQDYSVYGFSAQQLVRQMVQNGPFSQAIGRNVWAVTKARYHYNARLMSAADGLCHIRSLRVTVSIIMTLPRWVNKSQSRNCLQKRWKTMKDALVRHETNHKNRYITMQADIEKALGQVKPHFSCPRMHVRLDAAMEAAARRTHHWQTDYDRRTFSGQSEGVRLDPC